MCGSEGGRGAVAGRELPPLLPTPVGLVGRWGPVGRSGPPVDTHLPLTGTPCTSWATRSSVSSAPTSSFSWCGLAQPSPRTRCSSGSPWSESAGMGRARLPAAAPGGSANVDGGLLCAGPSPAPCTWGSWGQPKGASLLPLPPNRVPALPKRLGLVPRAAPPGGSSGPPVATAAGCCSEHQGVPVPGVGPGLARAPVGAGRGRRGWGPSFRCAQGEKGTGLTHQGQSLSARAGQDLEVGWKLQTGPPQGWTLGRPGFRQPGGTRRPPLPSGAFPLARPPGLS